MIFYFANRGLPHFKERSFTVLEVIIAIFVLTIAVGASYILIQKTFIASSLTQSKLIASYLAQEGIENIKNMRDANWLAGNSWNANIPGTYNENIINFIDGTQSKFKRNTSVVVEDFILGDYLGEDDIMKVTVNVSWNERGKDQAIEVVNYLYDWYSDPVCFENRIPQTCDDPKATELGCLLGGEGCRTCNEGVCEFYTDGLQHSCPDGQVCDENGICVDEG